MIVDLEKLEEQIKKMKNELKLTVQTAGLRSQESLHCSQRLDQLITIYQKNVSTFSKNNDLNGVN